MSHGFSIDNDNDLIARLRDRIADPDRRVDSRPSELDSLIGGMGFGGLVAMGRSLTADLDRLVADGPDPAIHARALTAHQMMSTPAARPLPEVATPEGLLRAETRLGFQLPPLLRRIYLELANGGFGPGFGIVGIRGGWTTSHGKTLEDLYVEMSEGDPDEPAWRWPLGLVPVVDLGGGFSCIDTTTPAGRVIEWDPEEIDEDAWARSFRVEAPSLAAWLTAWLNAPSLDDQMTQLMADAQATAMATSRAYWAAMTPEQKAAMGLDGIDLDDAVYPEYRQPRPTDAN